jgi:hypothetical protein
MSRRQTQIVVVCEDRTQEVLLRRYLMAMGYSAGARDKKVTFRIAPSGRGSGERFVLVQYAHELAEFRKRWGRNPQFHRLVAVIDADAGSVPEHEAELTAAAVASSQQPRTRSEGVVHLIPKRNVETWIHRLLGSDADEDTDYKLRYTKKPENEYCRPAADALADLVRDVNRQPDLPSLLVAVGELREKLSGSP